MDDLTGQTVRGYEFRERIGGGGFSDVYRAYQPSLKRVVAIKVIQAWGDNRPDFIQRFDTEAQTIARLEHPFIVPVYDYWHDAERAFLVMRYHDTGNLSHIIYYGELPLETIGRMVEQICAALTVAHRNGVIHRDVKPTNILTDRDGNFYLSDFGLAKDTNRPNLTDEAEGMVGTLLYMAPEQLMEERSTAQTDQFGFCITVFEALTGQHSYDNETISELIMKNLYGELPSLSQYNFHLPITLDTVMRRATAKNPEDRYPDALAFAAAFGEAIPPKQVFESINDKYETIELLKRGGMGEVYKGRHVGLNQIVAIKVLSDRLAGDAKFRERFKYEARAIAALKHPNIVQIRGFGETDGKYYMVMEYIDGPNLAEHMSDIGIMSIAQTFPLLQEIAQALDYAHAQGMVHRDIKPANVMLKPVAQERSKYTPILTDFGLAKIIGESLGLTSTDRLMGTVEYMAPEQVKSTKKVDHRADLYAFGVMIYEMLTGRLPFEEDSQIATALAHLNNPPPDPRDFVEDLPDLVAQALLRALAKHPDERFQTASALVAALK